MTILTTGRRAAAAVFASFVLCAGAAMSVVALTLAGGMMGMPFPLGMAKFDDRDRSWYWAINGATSVLASVLALVIALIAGFTVVLACAIAAYLVAALTLPESRRSA